MAGQSNRREFLKTSALTGAGFWVAGTKSVFAESKSPNEKLNVACVGIGGMGSTDASNFDKCGANIVVLCDVDDEYAKKTYDKFPNAKRFKDFREMFDKMHKEFDAVSVSTPDHTHAVVTMMAIKHGKHVYTQKPMAHDVYEARTMTKAAADNPKIVTQMGNQGTAEPGLREAVEVIQSGAIGPVKEVHVWTDRAGKWWPQGAKAVLNLPSVQQAFTGKGETPKAPAGLDWDLWLGTAPERPYQPPYLPFNWRAWWDFGTGALGDMACHTANMAFMACKLGYPTSVEAEVSEFNPQSCPTWSVVRYEFPARENMRPLTWMWYDGGNDKPSWVMKKLNELAQGEKIPGSGSLIVGEKGTLFSPNDYGAKYKLLPEKDFEGFKPPEPRLPRLPGGDQKVDPLHWREWVTACVNDKPEMCMSKFSYAGPLTETVVLGCVAQRVGKRIEWDGPNMKVTNVPEANQFIKREYRKGWSL